MYHLLQRGLDVFHLGKTIIKFKYNFITATFIITLYLKDRQKQTKVNLHWHPECTLTVQSSLQHTYILHITPIHSSARLIERQPIAQWGHRDSLHLNIVYNLSHVQDVRYYILYPTVFMHSTVLILSLTKIDQKRSDGYTVWNTIHTKINRYTMDWFAHMHTNIYTQYKIQAKLVNSHSSSGCLSFKGQLQQWMSQPVNGADEASYIRSKEVSSPCLSQDKTLIICFSGRHKTNSVQYTLD